MTTIVIHSTITTKAPLSISLPEASGVDSKFKNFPLMARGIDINGYKRYTGYLPATTIRGFLRRAVVLEAMKDAAKKGNHYTLQKAYEDLIGQDAESEAKQEIDLIKILEKRESNPIIDLFGVGLSLKSRILVSHFLPETNITPDEYTGVRKDLDDTEGAVESLVSSDQETFMSRSDSNSRRSKAKAVINNLRRDLAAAKKKKENEKIAKLEESIEVAVAHAKELGDEMGLMENSSKTVVSYFALPADIKLNGKIIVENAKDRDLNLIETALNSLSMRPLLGGQVSRGCGEIAGKFDISVDGDLIKTIEIGNWQKAEVINKK
jgi:CRISPR type IV-associated protein Csf2